MNVSHVGIDLIKAFEGCELRPYRCSADLWTIGYGHVLYKSHLRMKAVDRLEQGVAEEDDRIWSQDEVDSLLREDLVRFENGVLRHCPDSAFNQNHLDALVSFSFNCGLGALQASTLRQKYNRGEYKDAANEFLRWNKSGGRVLRGLTRRREAEREIFLIDC